MLLLVACAQGATPAPVPEASRPDASDGTAGTPGSATQGAGVKDADAIPGQGPSAIKQSAWTKASYVGNWRGKPPMALHYFDVALHNPSDGPRWLILPETFPYEGQDDPRPGGLLAELQIYRLSTQPSTIIAKGVGGNFWALRLPAGGDITIRRLPITSWWGDFPKSTPIELIIAKDVLVAGAPLESLFQGESLCQSGATVDAPSDAGDTRGEQFWHPADRLSGAPIEIVEESRERIVVALEVASP